MKFKVKKRSRLRVLTRTSRFKRSLVRRIKKRLQPWKNPKKQEVKFLTSYLNGFAVGALYTATPDATLYDRPIIMNSTNTDGILGKITQGTTKHTRVGNQIFVKKIVWKFYLWTCPTSPQTAYQDGIAARVLVTNTRAKYSGVGTYNVANYFDTPEDHHMIQSPMRSSYNVYHDKMYYWRPQIGVQGANAGNFMGYGRRITITLPINRVVTYNDDGIVKEDKDVINLYMWGHVPMNTTDNKQLLCGNGTVRMYFTDG